MLENRTEIFRIKAGALIIESLGRDEFALWSWIRWKDCLVLGEPIVKLITEHFGFEKGFISSKESFEYCPMRRNCHPCISFIIMNNDVIENDVRGIIWQLISGFLCEVVDNNNLQLDLSETRQIDQNINAIAEAHGRDFLKKHGGKKLATPLSIQSNFLVSKIQMGFKPKPPLEPKDPHKFQMEAQVVSLGSMNRKCALFACAKETEVSYNPNFFFSDLKKMLGEPLEAVFLLEESWDASGRESITLVSMSNIKLAPGLLL